jgi:hypothetical protein
VKLSFDEYWENLIGRIYTLKSESPNQDSIEKPTQNDLIFYRLTCIRGETMVSGVLGYFESRCDEFEDDMLLLKQVGFQHLAEKFCKAKNVLLGEEAINRSNFEPLFTKILDEEPNFVVLEKEIDKIFSDIIDDIEQLDEYRFKFAIQNGLFASW